MIELKEPSQEYAKFFLDLQKKQMELLAPHRKWEKSLEGVKQSIHSSDCSYFLCSDKIYKGSKYSCNGVFSRNSQGVDNNTGLTIEQYWRLIESGYSSKEILGLTRMPAIELIDKIINLHSEIEFYQDMRD
jgi:hypothetical protein